MNEIRMERVWRRCGFCNGLKVKAEGTRGGLCLAWKKNLMVQIRNYSKNHIDVEIQEDEVGLMWKLTGFYGAPDASHREYT